MGHSGPSRHARIQRSQLGESLGGDAMHYNLEIAVATYPGVVAAAANQPLKPSEAVSDQVD
jgi:hypothetical protein